MSAALEPAWAAALEGLVARTREIRRVVGAAWPYYADPLHGNWMTTDDGDWCGGHWVEMLRIAGVHSNDGSLLHEAVTRAERLRPYLERDDQFRGHRFYYSACRLTQWNGDTRARTLALAAAWAMRAMAMPVNGAMPIGTQVQVKSTTLASRAIVAVDNVHPNLRLDWWAYKETGDTTFLQGACRHLDTTIKDFVRADGSTVEFIEYAPDTGRVLREFTLLGAHDQSCWSRGQAWAIAGYLRAAEALSEAGADYSAQVTRYLAVAKKLFDFWWQRCEADGFVDYVPPWDFLDPAIASAAPASVPIDTSAAAIVCEALARLAVWKERPASFDFAVTRLKPLMDGLLGHVTKDGRLINGCFNNVRKVAENGELLWGNAYLMMALDTLNTRRRFD